MQSNRSRISRMSACLFDRGWNVIDRVHSDTREKAGDNRRDAVLGECIVKERRLLKVGRFNRCEALFGAEGANHLLCCGRRGGAELRSMSDDQKTGSLSCTIELFGGFQRMLQKQVRESRVQTEWRQNCQKKRTVRRCDAIL